MTTATVAALERRLQRLEDIEAIRQLKAAYCAGCDDDHDPDTLCALFVEDGVWDTPGLASCHGVEEIRRFMSELRASGRIRNSAHMVTNPDIRVDGDRARGHWRFLMVYTGNAPDGSTQYHRIIGYYDDDFVRRDGRWLFETLRPRIVESNAYTVEPSKFE